MTSPSAILFPKVNTIFAKNCSLVYAQCTLSVYSVYTQCILSVYSEHITVILQQIDYQ